MKTTIEIESATIEESVVVTLKKEVRRIINRKGNLYAFLKHKRNEIGELPSELLTYDLLHKLWLDENRVDSVIGELFGKTSRQISKKRLKLKITMKSESTYLFMYGELLKNPKGIAKVTGGKEKITKNEKRKLKSEFLQSIRS